MACLEQRLGTTDGMNGPSDPDAGPASVPTGAAAEGGTHGDTDSGPASAPGPAQSDKGESGEEDEGDRPPTPPPARPTAAPAGRDAGGSNWRGQEGAEALDLGATVLPVLLRAYGRQAAVGLLVLAVLAWLVRRRR